MRIAHEVATRATCPRAAVGAVFTFDNRILTTGYNGAATGQSHCTDQGCLMLDNHCVRVIHAEANAIVQAARAGVSLRGATVYCTLSPCVHCANLMIGVGVNRVVYTTEYFTPMSATAFLAARVKCERLVD